MHRAPQGFTVRQAGIADLPAVLEVQHHAFARVAKMFGIDPEVLPPLREGLVDLEALLGGGTRFFLAVTESHRVVGAVRASAQDDDSVEIGRLAVEDGWERRGVATALMEALEGAFPSARRFVLFTGAEAAGPLALYFGRGYTELRRETLPGVELVWLEKRVRS